MVALTDELMLVGRVSAIRDLIFQAERRSRLQRGEMEAGGRHMPISPLTV